MALFHLSVTQTKRSAGQSAIASAAYRAAVSYTHLYPIAYIKNKIPMAKKAAVCSYTVEGRALIHTNLSMNSSFLLYTSEEKKVPFKWEYGEETISLQLGMYANNQRPYIGMITHTEAVSYTHLDVYKRQGKEVPSPCESVETGRAFLHECAVRVSSSLEDWKERYAPEAPEDEPDERFVEAPV